MIRVTRRPPEVIVRWRRAETRLAGLFFMFYAGAGYMTANPFVLFLTTLLGYESDAILKANLDYAGIELGPGRYGGLAHVLKTNFDITVVSEGNEGKNVEFGVRNKIFQIRQRDLALRDHEGSDGSGRRHLRE